MPYWSPVFKRLQLIQIAILLSERSSCLSTRVHFLRSKTLLRAKLDAEILFWLDPCECGCCENSNADGNLTPWSVYRNFWMMRLWSCFLADEVFLVWSQARGDHARRNVNIFSCQNQRIWFPPLAFERASPSDGQPLQSGCWGKKDVNPRSFKWFANWRSNL